MGAERLVPAGPPPWLVPGVVGIAFAAYFSSLRTGIGFGDSGELVAAAIELGVPHPPGYPVWTLFAHLCTLLPGDDPAWKVACGSAVCMALAAGGIAWLLWRAMTLDAAREPTLARSALAAGGALLFAFSHEAWGAAIATEVYALHILLAVAVWVGLFNWGRGFLPRLMVSAAGFALGLGLANHQTLLLAVPGYVAFVVLWDWRYALRLRNVAVFVAPVLLGLAAYGLLPFWSARDPVVDWSNTETWRGFWAHLSRQQYRQLGLARSDFGTVADQLRFFGGWLLREYLGVVLVGALAVLATWRRDTRAGRAWVWGHLIAFAGSGLLFSYIANTELDNSNRAVLSVYFMLPGLSAILVGISAIGWWLETGPDGREKYAPWAGGIVLAMATAQALAVHSAVSRQASTVGRAFVAEVVRDLPDGTVVVAGTGVVHFGALYAKVTGVRPDLTAMSFNRLANLEYPAEIENQQPGLIWPAEQDYRAAFAEVAPGQTSVYGALRLARANGIILGRLLAANPGRVFVYDEGIPVPRIYANCEPAGLLLRLRHEPVNAVDAAVAERDREYWDALTESLLARNDFLTDPQARQAFSRRRSTIGGWYAWHHEWERAEYALFQALKLSGANVDASGKLAMVYAAQGDVPRGEGVLKAALDRDPQNRALRGLLRGYRAGTARWYGG